MHAELRVASPSHTRGTARGSTVSRKTANGKEVGGRKNKETTFPVGQKRCQRKTDEVKNGE